MFGPRDHLRERAVALPYSHTEEQARPGDFEALLHGAGGYKQAICISQNDEKCNEGDAVGTGRVRARSSHLGKRSLVFFGLLIPGFCRFFTAA